MSIIWKTHVWNTMQIWNENWMRWNLPPMNHLRFMVIHKYNDLLFTFLFGWKSRLISTILNIFKVLCIKDLAKSNLDEQDLHPSLIWSLHGGMDPTPHVGMPYRVNNLEEVILTNVGINAILFIVHHFTSDPSHMWHRFLFKQLSFFRYTKA
jgi:hypothetical protein